MLNVLFSSDMEPDEKIKIMEEEESAIKEINIVFSEKHRRFNKYLLQFLHCKNKGACRDGKNLYEPGTLLVKV